MLLWLCQPMEFHVPAAPVLVPALLPGDIVYDDPHVVRGPWKDFNPEDDWVDTELWKRYTDEWKGLYYRHQFTGEIRWERPDYKAAREKRELDLRGNKVREKSTARPLASAYGLLNVLRLR